MVIELGAGHVLVKDESNHFELPSFKILATFWSYCRHGAAQ
jgi:hypothetical protein